MKTKVLIIVESFGGGVRTHIIDLITNLDKSKYDIYVMYSLGRNDQVLIDSLDLLKENATLIENEFMQRKISLKEDVKAYIKCKKIIQEINPDIVHCHSSKAGLYGRVSAKRSKIKKIFYTPHAYYFQNEKINIKKKIFYVTIEKLLSRLFTTKTFNVSFGERNSAINNKIDAPNKFTVIYNGIREIKIANNNLLREELSLNNNEIIIGVTARLTEQKDPLTFAKIAKNIIKDFNYVHFVYIGDGPLEKELQNYIRINKMEQQFHILGFRSDADTLVACFDLYLITSLYEGLPYSPIEAMRAGVPILATRTTGNDEIVIEGKNGYLFEVKNAIEGAEYITKYLSNPSVLRKKEIIDVFNERFTIDKMISRIQEEYSKN